MPEESAVELSLLLLVSVGCVCVSAAVVRPFRVKRGKKKKDVCGEEIPCSAPKSKATNRSLQQSVTLVLMAHPT